MALLAIALTGTLMGFFAGFLGTGGGTLAIPALVILFGYDQKLAQGTVLVMVILNVVIGFFKYRRLSGGNGRLTMVLAASASLAAILGSRIMMVVPSQSLRVLYGLFLLALIIPLVMAKHGIRLASPLQPSFAAVPGVLGGVTLGMFGVGGAMLTVPFLTSCFGMRQVNAQGAALAVAVPGCLISFLPYLERGEVDWGVAGLLALCSLPTVSLGVKAAHRISETWLIAIFSCLIAITGLALLIN